MLDRDPYAALPEPRSFGPTSEDVVDGGPSARARLTGIHEA